MKLDALKKRLASLRIHAPEPEPWPPEEGSLGWLFYEQLGRPTERMSFMQMYLAAGRQFIESGGFDETG